METNFKYDPEDIESLLMHKQFNELFDEEKNFVLQHVENEEEYESLRKTLFELHDAALASDWLEPDPSIKLAVMQEFASEKKGGFLVWLNSLFTMPEIVWYRRPAFQIAFAGLGIAVVAFFLFTGKQDVPAFAENKNNTTSDTKPIDKENLFADNLSTQEFPPAPRVIDIPVVVSESPQVITEEVKSVEMEDHESESFSAPEGASSANSDSPAEEIAAPQEIQKTREEVDSKMEIKVSEKDKKFDTSSQPVTLTTTSSYAPSTSSNSAVNLSGVTSSDNVYAWKPLPSINSVSMSEMKDVIAVLYIAP